MYPYAFYELCINRLKMLHFVVLKEKKKLSLKNKLTMLKFNSKHNSLIKCSIFHHTLKEKLSLKNKLNIMSKYNFKFNSFINIITKIHIQRNRTKSFLIVEGHFDLIPFSCFFIRFGKISDIYLIIYSLKYTFERRLRKRLKV